MMHRTCGKMPALGPLQRSFIIFEVLICTESCFALNMQLTVFNI